MSTIQRVLFPIDFSTDNQALAPTVRRMIESWHAEVTLLHVMEGGQCLGRKHDLERLMAQMRVLAGEGSDPSCISARLERGTAGDRILQYVREHDIDLVVMSAGGSSNVYGRPIGHVADQVLTEATCAVWLDWGSARCRATAGMYARRLGCVLELDESDEYILSEAAEITAELEADLTVIHAVSPAPGKPVLPLWNSRVREQEVGLAKRRIEKLRNRFLPRAEVAVEIGPSHSVISRTIQNQDTGLLVTGNSREAILAAESECPVLRLATPAVSASSLAQPMPRYATARRSA